MFENISDKITEKLGEIGDTLKETIKANNAPFDVSKFDNPVAEKTDWHPLKPGGSNFQTHKLLEKSSEIRFKATGGIIFFSGIFMGVGILVPIFAMSQSYSRNELSDPLSLIMNLVPLIFFLIGFFLLRHLTKPIVFSKATGYFWKGRLKNNENPEQKPLKEYCRILDIVALQIVSEYIRGSSSTSSSSSSPSFRSYEINLILKDASRLNVIDHSRKGKLLKDAEKLAAYLGVPIWEGSRY